MSDCVLNWAEGVLFPPNAGWVLGGAKHSVFHANCLYGIIVNLAKLFKESTPSRMKIFV